MHLIIGGAFQGKTDWAKAQFDLKDADILETLNAVRENRLTAKLRARLHERVGVEPPLMDDGTEPIRLTTHNARADEVNSRKMAALKGESCSFIAQVEGDFPEHAYPAEEELQLKPGAQVMFIRNDSDGNYYNGKLGRVEKISSGVVTVTDQEGKSIDVTPVEWPNAQYELDEESGRPQ